MTLPAGIAASHARRLSRLALTLTVLAGGGACGSNPNSPSSVPQFGGNWTGTYLVTSCTSTGAFQDAAVCPANGTSAPFQLFLTQSDRIVNGSLTLGSIAFTSLGATVASDGSLAFLGTTNFSGILISVTFNLTVSGATLAGTVNQLWADQPATDQLTLTGTITTITKQ